MRTRSRWSVWWLVVGALAVVWIPRCASSSDRTLGDDDDGAESSATNPSQDGTNKSFDSVTRSLEESDIYKLVDDRMYILNRFRGLVVADVSNSRDLRMLGRLAIPAEPREMWVTQDTALIIASQKVAWGNEWGWHETSVDVDTMATYTGSALLAVDIRNPAQPTLVGTRKLEGDCFDGRLSGTALYLACESSHGSETDYLTSHVYSIDVSNPRQLDITTDLSFPRGQGEHHIYVNPRAIYLADTGGTTTIRYIDITSPQGVLVERGNINLSGTVIDRFAMDEWQGHLRVATGNTGSNSDAHVHIINVENPDGLHQVSTATLHVWERVMSARFDGPRGYLVTFRNVDPLFSFDLSDPAHPQLIGALEMTGWLDYMVPFGDRLVAMGHEDVDERVESGWWGTWTVRRRTLAVSLIDVSSGNPRLLSRVVLDGSWGEIPAERDDFNKLFRPMKDAGLVLFPYRTFRDGYADSAGVLLIDWKNDLLEKRADINTAGLVERAVPKDETTLFTLSLQSLNAYDIQDRSHPTLLSHLDLATQVTGFVLLDNGHVVEVSGDLGAGKAHLTARKLDDANPEASLSVLEMDAPMGRIWQKGNLVYFAGIHRPQMTGYYYDTPPDEEEGPHTTLTVVDYSNPAAPELVSSLDVGFEALQTSSKGFGSYNYWGRTTNRTDALLVDGDKLILTARQARSGGGCLDSYSVMTVITVVDLGNPEKPRLASRHEINGMIKQLAAHGSVLSVLTEDAAYKMDVAPRLHMLRQLTIPAIDYKRFPPQRAESQVLSSTLGTIADQDMVLGWSSDGESRPTMTVYHVDGEELREVDTASMTEPLMSPLSSGNLLAAITSQASSLNLWKVEDGSLKQTGSASILDYLSAHGQLLGLLDMDGSNVFVLWDDMIQLYDIRDLSRPTRAGQWNVIGVCDNAQIANGRVHVAGGYRGLLVLPLPQH